MARLISVAKRIGAPKKILHKGRHKTWYIEDLDRDLIVDPALAVPPANAFPAIVPHVHWICPKCERRWPCFSTTHSAIRSGMVTNAKFIHPAGCDDRGCPICLGTLGCGPFLSKKKLKKRLAEQATPKPPPALISSWRPSLLPGEFSVELEWIYCGKKETKRWIIKNRHDYDDVRTHRCFMPVSDALFAVKREDRQRTQARWLVRDSSGAAVKFSDLDELVPKTKSYLAAQEKLGLVDGDPSRWPRYNKVNAEKSEKSKESIKLQKAFEIFLDGVDYELDNSEKVATIKRSPLANEFFAKIKELESQGIPANVVTLYHGTKAMNVAPIITNGFKLPNSGNKSALAFGDGIYFGKWEKATNYAITSSLEQIPNAPKRKYSVYNIPNQLLSVLKSHRNDYLEKSPQEIDEKEEERVRRRRERRYQRFVKANCWLEPYLENSRFIIECDIILGNKFYPDNVLNQAAAETVKNSDGKYQSTYYHGTFKNAEWIVYDPCQVFIRRVHFYKPSNPLDDILVDSPWTPEFSESFIIGLIARNRVKKTNDMKLQIAWDNFKIDPKDDTLAILKLELERNKLETLAKQEK